MKIRMTNEAKTGVMVLACVVALALLILKVGNFTLLQKGWTVKSRFHFTAGVKKHAPVRLSGVDVGEVKDLQMIYGDETIIEMTLWIQDGVKMRRDSTAYVTTLGMMGEKYIEIKAGTDKSEWAQDGQLIQGADPMRLEDLLEMGTKIGDSIDKMAKDISKLANNVDRTVADNRVKIDNIFGNLEETSSNFREFSQDIKFHPWKILMKGRERSKEELEKDHTKQVEVREAAKAAKNNFAAKKEAA
jgi:phospholipid/cholesterol/gamma-HCH transport system substrate-binding protein